MLVFDASTLILTAKVDLLDLFLDNLGMEAMIPKAVEEECCAGAKTLDALVIQRALDESKIRVRGVRNKKLVRKLEEDFTMGRGESEAIALALEEKALLVAIDDKRGMNACKLVGIPFITSIAILVRSHEKGLISRSDALIRLSALGRHGRYRNSILADARQRLEERP